MMDTQFKKFLQIGIIVEDIEKTIKNYEEYGVGPWRVAPLDSNEFLDFTMNGKKERLQDIMAFCDIWGFELELIQPISDSPYMTWLKEHGPGMHHIALSIKKRPEEIHGCGARIRRLAWSLRIWICIRSLDCSWRSIMKKSMVVWMPTSSCRKSKDNRI
ncbi:MAG: VOC family protein [Oscillospiraceae bacterium]|nr:VOC family protein [Oscillospiraceae bacterium]